MRDAAGQSAMVQVFWYWMPAVLYASAIFYLSSQSHPEDKLPSFLLEEVSDKVLHAVEYAILAVLCYRLSLGSGAVCRSAGTRVGDHHGFSVWHHR